MQVNRPTPNHYDTKIDAPRVNDPVTKEVLLSDISGALEANPEQEIFTIDTHEIGVPEREISREDLVELMAQLESDQINNENVNDNDFVRLVLGEGEIDIEVMSQEEQDFQKQSYIERNQAFSDMVRGDTSRAQKMYSPGIGLPAKFNDNLPTLPQLDVSVEALFGNHHVEVYDSTTPRAEGQDSEANWGTRVTAALLVGNSTEAEGISSHAEDFNRVLSEVISTDRMISHNNDPYINFFEFPEANATLEVYKGSANGGHDNAGVAVLRQGDNVYIIDSSFIGEGEGVHNDAYQDLLSAIPQQPRANERYLMQNDGQWGRANEQWHFTGR